METAIKFARSSRRGMALIWVSITMFVMIGFIGLALDTGYAVLVGAQMQHAADAAALAGAQIVRQDPTTVKSKALAIGDSNTAAGAAISLDRNADVTIGTYASGAFSTGGLAPNAVRVVPKRTASANGAVPLFFGAIFGSPTIDMTRTATAMVTGTGSPTLMILDPNSPCSLDVKGSALLKVIGGPIQVNSSNNNSACIGGTTGVTAEALDVTGTVRGSNNALIDTLINEHQPAIPDPLAGLAAPTIPSGQPGFSVSPGTTLTVNPGYYNSTVTVQGTLVMNSGIYVFGGQGLKVTSQATVIGNGVMLYFTGNASLDMSSDNATATLRAPDPTVDSFTGADTYAGIVIFQARDDGQTSKLSLNGSINIQGTMYFPAAEFDISAGGSQVGSRIIANQMKLTGSGTVLINNRANGATDGRPYLVQ